VLDQGRRHHGRLRDLPELRLQQVRLKNCMLNKAPIAGRGKEMKHKVWGWVLAAVAFPVVAQEADGVEWPLPWRIGTTLEYDQVYVSTNRRDGQEFTVKATDVARISIERADADGYVQRWVSTDPKYDLSALPEQARLAVTAAAEALRDLPLDVRLNAEGAYLGLVDLETLRQKYRSAMETAFERILQPYSDQLPSDGEAILARVIDTLTAPSVVEQQFAELPAAYNFVAGGGLAPGVEYAYEDQGLNPLGGESIAMHNTLTMSEPDRLGIYEIRWRIEPDVKALTAAIEHAAEEMLGDALASADAAQQAEAKEAMAAARSNAEFTTTVIYRVDGSSGVVQRMEHVQVKRFANKDETTTNVLRLRPRDADDTSDTGTAGHDG
jgi:hypothetical protein